MAVLERGLHRVHGAVLLGQALDGHDVGARNLGCQDVAGLDRVPVQDDGTGAALRGIATDMGSGQLEVFS